MKFIILTKLVILLTFTNFVQFLNMILILESKCLPRTEEMIERDGEWTRTVQVQILHVNGEERLAI